MDGSIWHVPVVKAWIYSSAVTMMLVAPSGMVMAQPGHSIRTAKRISFSRGSICGSAAGILQQHTSRYFFVVHASAAQRMIVNVIPTSTQLAAIGIVIFPGGKQDGSPGGVVFDSKLTKTGDYVIQVSPHNMADNRFPGKFRVEVVIH